MFRLYLNGTAAESTVNFCGCKKDYTIPMVNFVSAGSWTPYGPFIPVNGVLNVTGAIVKLKKKGNGTALKVSRQGYDIWVPEDSFTWYSSNSFDDIVDDFDRHLTKQKLFYDSKRFELDGPEYQAAIKEMSD